MERRTSRLVKFKVGDRVEVDQQVSSDGAAWEERTEVGTVQVVGDQITVAFASGDTHVTDIQHVRKAGETYVPGQRVLVEYEVRSAEGAEWAPLVSEGVVLRMLNGGKEAEVALRGSAAAASGGDEPYVTPLCYLAHLGSVGVSPRDASLSPEAATAGAAAAASASMSPSANHNGVSNSSMDSSDVYTSSNLSSRATSRSRSLSTPGSRSLHGAAVDITGRWTCEGRSGADESASKTIVKTSATHLTYLLIAHTPHKHVSITHVGVPGKSKHPTALCLNGIPEKHEKSGTISGDTLPTGCVEITKVGKGAKMVQVFKATVRDSSAHYADLAALDGPAATTPAAPASGAATLEVCTTLSDAKTGKKKEVWREFYKKVEGTTDGVIDAQGALTGSSPLLGPPRESSYDSTAAEEAAPPADARPMAASDGDIPLDRLTLVDRLGFMYRGGGSGSSGGGKKGKEEIAQRGEETVKEWLGFAYTVVSLVTTSYLSVVEEARQTRDGRRQVAAFLKLAAAAQYNPLAPGEYEALRTPEKRGRGTQPRLSPKLDFGSGDGALRDYFGSTGGGGSDASARLFYFNGVPSGDDEAEAAAAAARLHESVMVFTRGESTVPAGPRVGDLQETWNKVRTLGRKSVGGGDDDEEDDGSEVPCYDNVLVVYPAAMGGEATAGKGDGEVAGLTARLYTRVPKADVCLLMPNSRGLQLSTYDLVCFAATAVPSLCLLVAGFFALLAELQPDEVGGEEAELVEDLGVVVVTVFVVGCLVKAMSVLSSFLFVTNELDGLLAQWRIERTEASGTAALMRLASQVTEQETKEALLGFHLLNKCCPERTVPHQVLEERAAVLMKSLGLEGHTLELRDSFAKLQALGLTCEVPGTDPDRPSQRLVTGLKQFQQRRYTKWVQLLGNHFADVIDSRVPQ